MPVLFNDGKAEREDKNVALSYFSEPINIFFSLASVDLDRKLFQKLCTHLSSQKQQGLIDIHYDNDIAAGSDYREIIHSYIREADIIVLLLSADFFDSDECVKREMPWAFEEHDRRAACVIPVFLRPAEWSGFDIERYSPLPSNGKPISPGTIVILLSQRLRKAFVR